MATTPSIIINVTARDRNASRVAGQIERAIRRVEGAAVSADGKTKDFGVGFLRAAANVGRDIEQIGRSIEQFGLGIRNVGIAISAVTTLPLIAGLQASASAAIEFESAFAGVIKTVDGLVVSGTINELNEQGLALKQGLIDLSREIPTTATELARIGELAGQLGVGAEDIGLFTRVIAEFVESTDVGLDDAAKSLAQIANVFGQEVDDRFSGSISRFADATTNAIVELGNNFATTESEILQFFQTFAGNAAGAGISVEDTLAIATAFRSVRATSAASSTALQRFFQSLQTSASTSVSALQPFLDVVNAVGTEAEGSFNVAAEQLRQLSLEDPGEALFLFLRGLREFGPEIPNVLVSLGLGDRRLIRELNKAAGGVDELREALDLGSRAFGEFGENGARAIESARRFATVESQIQLLKNDIQALAIAIGDRLLPVIETVIDSLRDGVGNAIEFFDGLSDSSLKTILVIGGLVAAVGPALIVIGSLISIVGKTVQAFGLLQAGINSLTANLIAFRTAQASADVAANTLGLSVLNMGAKFRQAATFVRANLLAFSGLAAGIIALVAVIALMDSTATRLGDTLNDNVENAVASAEAFRDLEASLGDNAEANFQQQKTIALAVNSYEEYTEVLAAAGASTNALSEQQFEAARQFGTLSEAADVARGAVDAYRDSLDGISGFEQFSLGLFGTSEINDGQGQVLDALIGAVGVFEAGTDDAAESIEQLRNGLRELNEINIEAGLGNILGVNERVRGITNDNAEELLGIIEALQLRGATNEQIIATITEITGDERLALFAIRDALSDQIEGGFFADIGASFQGVEGLTDIAIAGLDQLASESVEAATDVDELVGSIEDVQGILGVLDVGEVALFTTLQEQSDATAESIAGVIASLRNIDLSRLTPDQLGLTEGEAVNFGFDIDSGQFTDLEGAINAAVFAIQTADAATLGLSETQEISVAAIQAWINEWPQLTDEVGRAATAAALVQEAYTALGLSIRETFIEGIEDAIDAAVAFVDAQDALSDALHSGDVEEITEAYSELSDAQEDLIASSNDLLLELSRIELIQGPEGFETSVREIDEAYIELSRALGVYTDAQADAAIQTFRSRQAIEELTVVAKFLGLTAEETAAAQILVRDGLAETTDEAIKLVVTNSDLVDKTLEYNRALSEQGDEFANAVANADAYVQSLIEITDAQNEALANVITEGRGLVNEIFTDEEPTIDFSDGLFNFDFEDAEDRLAEIRDLFQQTAFDILSAGQELTTTEQIQLELDFGIITPEQAQLQQQIVNVQNALRVAFGTILIDNVPVNLNTLLGDVDQTQLIEDITNATTDAERDLSGLLSLVAAVAVEYSLDETETQSLTQIALDNAAQGQADIDAVTTGVTQVIDVSTSYNLVEATTPDTLGPSLTEGDQDVVVTVSTAGIAETVADLAIIAAEADTAVGEEARKIIFETNLEEVNSETTEFDELATIIANTDYTVSFDDTSVGEALEAVRELETEVTDLSATITYQIITNGEPPEPQNSTVPAGSSGATGGGSGQGGFFGGGVVGGLPGIDRNLAWLSKGEYVLPRAAMREGGVKQLMDMLRGGLSLKQATGRMGLGNANAEPRLSIPGISIDMPALPPSTVSPIIDAPNITNIDNSEVHIDNSRKADIKVAGQSEARQAARARQSWGRF